MDQKMILLRSIVQRQLYSNQWKSHISTDFAISSFCCHRADGHIVRGRDETMEVPPFASQFSKSELGGHLLASADEDGSIKLFDTRRYGSRSILREWTAHSNAVFDIAWMNGQPKLVTASGDQTAMLWDVERGESLSVFKGHSSSLKSVNFRENDIFTFATGSRDGNIMVWDIRCNHRDGFYKPVNTIRNAHTIQVNNTPQRVRKRSRRGSVAKAAPHSVTAVIFQDENKLISAGAMDGNIKVWDLRKNYSTLRHDPVSHHVFPYPGNEPRRHGFSSLVLDSNQSKLFASCTNDKIYVYECTVLKESPVCSYSGHYNTTFYIKAALSPDDTFLLSGSSDNDAYIWNVKRPQVPPVVLKGHLGEVTSVAWCPVDLGKLVTCSDDNNVRIWRINRNQEAKDKSDFIGTCKQSEPRQGSLKPCDVDVSSIGTPLTPCLSPVVRSHYEVYDQYSSPRESPSGCKSPIIQPGSPFQQGKIGSVALLDSPLSPAHSSTSNSSSPMSTKNNTKQQSLRTWFKVTPTKEKSALNPSADIQHRHTECLTNGRLQPEKGHPKNISTSLEETMNITKKCQEGTRNNMNLSSEESSLQSIQTLSPARKRPCISGLSDLNNYIASVENGIEEENEKENIEPKAVDGLDLNSTAPEKGKSNIDSSDILIWKNYLKYNKTDEKREAETPVTNRIMSEELPSLPQGQTILKYFKPKLSPVKDNE